MLKQLFLTATLVVMPLTFFAQSELETSINATLEHIKQEKAAIMLEMKTSLILKNKTESFFKVLLQNSYDQIKEEAIGLINSIILSSEFLEFIDQVTTHQTDLIVNKMIKFNDVINPSAFSLEKKVNDELVQNTFNKESRQIFNILYLVFVSTSGSALLIKKLEAKEAELLAELQALQALENVVNV